MPRKALIRSDRYPYHVTNRCNNREPFPLPAAEVWPLYEERLYEITYLFQARIHAVVLMPNHFHLLVTTPNEDLGEVMMHFVRSITKDLNLKTGQTGRVFGSRYHWSLVDSERYFLHAYKYLYRNPVRARLSSTAEEYPFSTLPGLLGEQTLNFPLHYPYEQSAASELIKPYLTDLNWLNRPTIAETEKRIRMGLRRLKFQLPRDSNGVRSDLLPLDEIAGTYRPSGSKLKCS